MIWGLLLVWEGSLLVWGVTVSPGGHCWSGGVTVGLGGSLSAWEVTVGLGGVTVVLGRCDFGVIDRYVIWQEKVYKLKLNRSCCSEAVSSGPDKTFGQIWKDLGQIAMETTEYSGPAVMATKQRRVQGQVGLCNDNGAVNIPS